MASALRRPLNAFRARLNCPVQFAEYAVINEVSKHGLCKPVIAKYANGLCYTYTPGNTLNSAQMLTEDFLEEAAFKFARSVAF